MLNLSKIPAEELNQTVKNLALQERKLTEQILWHIAEVDRLELTFSQAEMEIFRKAQELLTHQTGGGLKETLVALAEKLIQRQNSNNKSIEKVSVASPTATMTMMTVKTTATVAVKPTGALTPNLKQRVFHRDQCCQYKDRQTGKVCGSRYFLEVDHIKPRFVGGTNEFENLRVLCRNHNIYRYKTGS